MRILHVPTNTGAHPQGLARAERAIGLRSWAVALMQTRFNMDVDEVLWPNSMDAVSRLKKQVELIRRAVRDYDIIHYNNGKTIAALPLPGDPASMGAKQRLIVSAYRRYAALLQAYELNLLRRSGKPYFVTYQGSDARQRDYCVKHFDISFFHEPDCDLVGAEQHIRQQIALLTKNAVKVYALNPDLLHVLPETTEFLPYASVDLDDWEPCWRDGDRPRIVHAPSRRWVKGTHYILDAVDRLRAEGLDFEFELVENMTHAEARCCYERAHLLIDQLLAGWYGGLAVELMALGKPVVCYLRDKDLQFIPDKMRRDIPVIQATPNSIYDVLKDWLSRPLAEWHARGEAGRTYVEDWHDPLKIAARLKTDYESALGVSVVS